MRMKDYFAAKAESQLPQNLTNTDYQEMLKADPDYQKWLDEQESEGELDE